MCTTVAIAIVAETCAPFTVVPALMNEFRVPELNVQNGVLKVCACACAFACVCFLSWHLAYRSTNGKTSTSRYTARKDASTLSVKVLGSPS